MNVSNVVPPVLERLSIRDNSKVKNLVIGSLDNSRTLVLNEDSFHRCTRKEKDAPKNLFELLKRLLSPQRGDVDRVVERLAFPSQGYRVSADVLSGKNVSEVNGIVMSHGKGFTIVGASGASVGRAGLKSPKGVISDGYQDGRLVSSENHLLAGNVYYKDIVLGENGVYRAGSVKNRAY